MENVSPDLDDLKKNIRSSSGIVIPVGIIRPSSGIVIPGRCLIISPVRLFRTLLKSQM